MEIVESWGRLSHELHDSLTFADRHQVSLALANGQSGLPFGNGRSYGDSCLNPGGVLWRSTSLGRFIAFDLASGVLSCESGVLLRDIQELAVPQGWSLAVSPGTQLVTVGGAIANDVHGKNHHRLGSFGDHVRHMILRRTDGTSIACGPHLHKEWFAATVGGLGLTGFITEVELQLKPVPGPWFDVHSVPFLGLKDFFSLADGAEEQWEYTVAWVDCLSGRRTRGIFMRGNWSPYPGMREPETSIRTMPVTPPVSLVNQLTLRPFNLAYYQLHRLTAGPSIQHYRKFLCPLDGLLHWNRMYGRRGFFQYQCVVPRAGREEVIAELLEQIRRSGSGSFLAVLKTFAERPAPGLLSFAREGVTLALDFANAGEYTLRLFRQLDAIVNEAGGRLYPAKDARMARSFFERSYPRLAEFLPFRDPGISSAMSRRLMGS